MHEMDAIRHLSDQAKSFKPVKEVMLEKSMNLIVVTELRITLPKMIHPVTACILDIQWNTALRLQTPHLAYKSIWMPKIAYIPL